MRLKKENLWTNKQSDTYPTPFTTILKIIEEELNDD